MPRGPRLDAPGVLHHVMARGIERRKLPGSGLYFVVYKAIIKKEIRRWKSGYQGIRRPTGQSGQMECGMNV